MAFLLLRFPLLSHPDSDFLNLLGGVLARNSFPLVDFRVNVLSDTIQKLFSAFLPLEVLSSPHHFFRFVPGVDLIDPKNVTSDDGGIESPRIVRHAPVAGADSVSSLRMEEQESHGRESALLHELEESLAQFSSCLKIASLPVDIVMMSNFETELAVVMQVRTAKRSVGLELLPIVGIETDWILYRRTGPKIVTNLGTALAPQLPDRVHV